MTAAHCVYPQPGAKIEELPEEWQKRAREILRGWIGGRSCTCGKNHRLIPEEDVARLKAAGFLVELEYDG